MKNRKFWLPVVLLLAALSVIQLIPCRYNHKSGFIQMLPERFRSFVAAYLWEKADHLMHEGPVLEKQNFQAGSYAGNTDIVPLLKMIITLCPDQTAPYRLLATNYAYHLGMKSEALNLLDAAKINCSNSINCHEIYASEAFIRLFTKTENENNRQVLEKVISLLDEAIYKFKPDVQFPDPAFTLENYIDVKSSLQAKLDNPETFSKHNEISTDVDDKNATAIEQNEAHHSHQKEENLLQLLIILVIKAGLITGLGIIFYSSRFRILWN